jgi:NADH-quinone oxidoreductase subunit E
MLTREQVAEILAKGNEFPLKRSALIPALQIAQREKGHLDSSDMKEIADLLSLSTAEVYGAATFYHMIRKKPGGKHTIAVCINVSCSLRGAGTLSGHLQQRLGVRPGEVTGDGMFLLEEAQCLGCCDGAPCMMVDGELYGSLTGDRVDEILEVYRGKAARL